MKIEIRNERIIQQIINGQNREMSELERELKQVKAAAEETEKLKEIIGSLEHENDVLSQRVVELDSEGNNSEENDRLKERLSKSVADSTEAWDKIRDRDSTISQLDEIVIKLQRRIDEKDKYIETVTKANAEQGDKVESLLNEIEVLKNVIREQREEFEVTPKNVVGAMMAELETDRVEKLSGKKGRPKKYPNEVAE